MHYTWRVVVVVVGVVAPNVVIAQDKGSACSLLTPKEISDAVGATVGNGTPNETVVQTGPAKGETLHGCQWRAGETATLSVSTIRAPSRDQRAAGLARMNQAFAALRARGWTAKSETFGSDLKCSMMTAPSGTADTPNMTGCMGEANGQALGVGFMSPGSAMPIAKVKTLFDKAIARVN